MIYQQPEKVFLLVNKNDDTIIKSSFDMKEIEDFQNDEEIRREQYILLEMTTLCNHGADFFKLAPDNTARPIPNWKDGWTVNNKTPTS